MRPNSSVWNQNFILLRLNLIWFVFSRICVWFGRIEFFRRIEIKWFWIKFVLVSYRRIELNRFQYKTWFLQPSLTNQIALHRGRDDLLLDGWKKTLLYTDELRRIELKKQESKIYLWIRCDLIRLYETRIFYLFIWFVWIRLQMNLRLIWNGSIPSDPSK